MSHPTAASVGLHVMAKPIGPICNLDCAYCYYLEKEKLYPAGERFRMPEDTLKQYIEQYIAAQPPQLPEIDFAWQGGEPTLLGVDFFQRVVELQQEIAPERTCRNSLQTNGTLLDEQWARFLKQENFLVGLSIDGPAQLHDHYRYDKQGRGSFAEADARLATAPNGFHVEHNLLVVVNRVNERPSPRRVPLSQRERCAVHSAHSHCGAIGRRHGKRP